MAQNDTTQKPTRIDIERSIEDNAAELAEAEQNASPGTTRVSLLVRRDTGDVSEEARMSSDDVSARVRTDHRHATPIPELAENEVYLWKIADVLEWHESEHREWWLSGEGVEDEGIEFFDHTEGAEY